MGVNSRNVISDSVPPILSTFRWSGLLCVRDTPNSPSGTRLPENSFTVTPKSFIWQKRLGLCANLLDEKIVQQ
jgi:hypothetical protein